MIQLLRSRQNPDFPETDDNSFLEVGTVELIQEGSDSIYIVKPLYPFSDNEQDQVIRYLALNFEVFDISEDSIPEDLKEHSHDGYYLWNQGKGFFKNENWVKPEPIFEPTRTTFETAAQLEYIAAINNIEL